MLTSLILLLLVQCTSSTATVPLVGHVLPPPDKSSRSYKLQLNHGTQIAYSSGLDGSFEFPQGVGVGVWSVSVVNEAKGFNGSDSDELVFPFVKIQVFETDEGT